MSTGPDQPWQPSALRGPSSAPPQEVPPSPPPYPPPPAPPEQPPQQAAPPAVPEPAPPAAGTAPQHPAQAPLPPQPAPAEPPEPPQTAPAQPPADPDQALRDRLTRRASDGWRARLRHRVKGALSSDDTPQRLAAAWHTAQTPVATGRRIWVAGAHGGAGTSTLAVALAQELQARRPDGVALVDAAPGRTGLGERLAQPVTGPVRPDLAQSRTSSTGPLLTFAPAPEDLADADELATRLRRYAALTFTDAGLALPTQADQADVIVVAAAASLRGLRTARGAVAELLAGGWDAWRIVLVLTELDPQSGIGATEAAEALAGTAPTRAPVGHDRHLAGAAGIVPGHVGEPGERDLAEVAAAVVSLAARPV